MDLFSTQSSSINILITWRVKSKAEEVIQNYLVVNRIISAGHSCCTKLQLNYNHTISLSLIIIFTSGFMYWSAHLDHNFLLKLLLVCTSKCILHFSNCLQTFPYFYPYFGLTMFQNVFHHNFQLQWANFGLESLNAIT